MEKIFAIIICFAFNTCYSQVGEWTWMNGSDSLYSLGHYGIQGVADSLNSPPSLYEPCEFQDQQGNFWLFGGFHGNMIPDPLVGDLNDLWKYNPITNKWTWIKGSGIPNNMGSYGIIGISDSTNIPAARGWGTPTWSDNNGNFWIYSGNVGYNDLWKYNVSTNEWTWMHGSTSAGAYNNVFPVYGTFQVASPLNTPGTRAEMNTTWTDSAGNLWLFGGSSWDIDTMNIVNYNDLWKFDISINQWIWMSGSNVVNDNGYYGVKGIASPLNLPPARTSYSKWKDNAGNFYFFGGVRHDLFNASCISKSYNDVWKFEISSNNWVWLSGDSASGSYGIYSPECIISQLNTPRNSWENRATSHDSNGNVFLFSGLSNTCLVDLPLKNEIWHYSVVNNEWTLIQSNSSIHFGTKGISSSINAPPRKFGSISWLRDGEFWIFGGSQYGNSDSYNDLWRFVIDTTCFPSGIYENEIINEPTVFPNPTSSLITISFELLSMQNFELRIYNTLGQIVYFSEEENEFGKFEKQLNVQNLSNGIYYLQVRFKSTIFNEKIVKH